MAGSNCREQQQSGLERALAAAGTPVPSGMHIDQGGNLNQKNRLVRNTAIAAGVAAGGYFAAPYIAGALAGSGGAGAALPTSLAGEMSGVIGGPAGAIAGTTGATAAAGTSSTAAALTKAALARAAGNAAGSAADTMANNRSVRADLSLDEEEMRRRRQQLEWSMQLSRALDRRESQEHAWQTAARANYMANPNMPDSARYKPTRSPEQLAAAEAARKEAQARLDHGDSFLPQVPNSDFRIDRDLLEAGAAERALGIGSAAGSIAGAVPPGMWRKLIDIIK